MFGRPKAPPVPQLSPLSDGEVQWRDNQLAVAAVLAEAYVGDSTNPPSLASLDAVVAGWLADDQGIDINTVANAVGIAFGDHVARDADLSWVIATDQHGSDLALHGQPGDLLAYPANAVAKRLVERQTAFLTALHTELVRAARRERNEH